MRKILGYFPVPVISLVCVLLQATVLYRCLPGSPWGDPICAVTPDLIQLGCWLAALRAGMLGSTWFGFWGGLWLGAFVGEFGPSLMMYTLFGWLSGIAAELQPNPRSKDLIYWSLAGSLFLGLGLWLAQTLLVGEAVSLRALAMQFPGQMIWQLLSLLILAKLRFR